MDNCNRFSKFEKTVIKFQDLDKEYQKAAALYLRNYEGPINKNARFILYEIPMSTIKKAIMAIPEMTMFSDFDDYHRFYREKKAYQKKETIWPIFIDRSFGMVIEEGWGRLHNYVDDGLETVPALELYE